MNPCDRNAPLNPVQAAESCAPAASAAEQKPQESSWRGHRIVEIVENQTDYRVVSNVGIATGVFLIGSLMYMIAVKICQFFNEFFNDMKKLKAENAEEIVRTRMPEEILKRIKQIPLDIDNILIRLADASNHELSSLKYILENFEISDEETAEILKGAHVHLKDQGYRYQIMKPYGKVRPSSHESQDEQFSLQGPFGREWLHGLRLPKNEFEVEQYTTLQLESHPFTSLMSVSGLVYGILHLGAYFRYLITGKQQGPFGESVYTDQNPLKLSMKIGSPLHRRISPPEAHVLVVEERTQKRQQLQQQNQVHAEYMDAKVVVQNAPNHQEVLAEWGAYAE